MALYLSLLGESEIRLNGKTIEDLSAEKAQGLLFYLAVESDRAHRREFLAEMLWPERPMGYGRNNLKQNLSLLRSALGDRKSRDPYLITSYRDLQFNTDSLYEVDVLTFQKLSDQVNQHCQGDGICCGECASLLEQVVQLYQDDFLSDFYLSDSPEFNEWVLAKRESYKRIMSESLSKLIRFCERDGKLSAAVDYAHLLVNLEPWNENSHRTLMRLLAATGKRSAALKQYHACASMLSSEFGAKPMPSTQQLYEDIKAWDRTSDFIPSVSSPSPAESVPEIPQPTPSPLKWWVILTASLSLLILTGVLFILLRPTRENENPLAGLLVSTSTSTSAGLLPVTLPTFTPPPLENTEIGPQSDPPATDLVASMPIDEFSMSLETACLPGESLLYLEDFQDGQAQGWPQIEFRAQNWEIDSDPEFPENLVALNPGFPGTMALYREGDFQDAVFRLRFKGIGFPQPLFLWHSHDEPYDTDRGTVHDSDYSIGFMHYGNHFERYTFPLEEVSLQEGDFYLDMGIWHYLEISTYQGLLRVWLDGKELLAYQDPQPLPGGTIGIGLGISQEENSMVLYDDLRVCELTGPFVSQFESK